MLDLQTQSNQSQHGVLSTLDPVVPAHSVEGMDDSMPNLEHITATTLNDFFPPEGGMFFDGPESMSGQFDIDFADTFWQLPPLVSWKLRFECDVYT